MNGLSLFVDMNNREIMEKIVKWTSMKISSACLVSLAVLKPDLFIIFVLLSLSVIALAIYGHIHDVARQIIIMMLYSRFDV